MSNDFEITTPKGIGDNREILEFSDKSLENLSEEDMTGSFEEVSAWLLFFLHGVENNDIESYPLPDKKCKDGSYLLDCIINSFCRIESRPDELDFIAIYMSNDVYYRIRKEYSDLFDLQIEDPEKGPRGALMGHSFQAYRRIRHGHMLVIGKFGNSLRGSLMAPGEGWNENLGFFV